MTARCSAGPTPVPPPCRSEPREPAGSSQERVGQAGRQGSGGCRPSGRQCAGLRRSPEEGFPSAMPMAARGPASPRNERSCSRGTHRRQIRSGRRRGRPRAGAAGARARQSRDARTLRRSDSSPSGEGAGDSTRGRWGLVAAPWERRRITARTEIANGRGEHPTRATSAGGRVSAADAPSSDRAHRRARIARAVRRTPLQRRASPEPQRANRKERLPRWRCFDPPLVHVRIVVRRSLDLGTTPGTSFAGVHGSEGGLSAPARRAQAGSSALDEVSR